DTFPRLGVTKHNRTHDHDQYETTDVDHERPQQTKNPCHKYENRASQKQQDSQSEHYPTTLEKLPREEASSISFDFFGNRRYDLVAWGLASIGGLPPRCVY